MMIYHTADGAVLACHLLQTSTAPSVVSQFGFVIDHNAGQQATVFNRRVQSLQHACPDRNTYHPHAYDRISRRNTHHSYDPQLPSNTYNSNDPHQQRENRTPHYSAGPDYQTNLGHL